MTPRTITTIGLCLGFLTAAASVGCDGPPAGRGRDEPLGAITLDLTLAPVDARCAVVTVTPQMGPPVQRQIPLTPEVAATFTLAGLPTGPVTVTEQVFTVACSMVGTAMATWVSDPVMVTLDAAGAVTLSFNLRRTDAGGQVTIISNFPTAQPTFRDFTSPTVPQVSRVTVGPDDNIWFTGAAVGQIVRMTTAGIMTVFTAPSGFPLAIAPGPDGNLWVSISTTPTGGNIARVTPSGAITVFVLGDVPAASFPRTICSGPDGNIWFTESAANKIGRISPSGTLTQFNVPTAGGQPFGIAVGPDGNLWFAEQQGNKIGRITRTGTIVEFTLPTANAGARDIVAGADGNLWFTEITANRIGRISTSGTIVDFAVPTPMSDLGGITAGPDGNVWFTETSGNKLGRITPAGAITEVLLPAGSLFPVDIVNGPDANLWFGVTSPAMIEQLVLHP